MAMVAEYPEFWLHPLFYIDFPLCIVADTLTLPYTIVAGDVPGPEASPFVYDVRMD